MKFGEKTCMRLGGVPGLNLGFWGLLMNRTQLLQVASTESKASESFLPDPILASQQNFWSNGDCSVELTNHVVQVKISQWIIVDLVSYITLYNKMRCTEENPCWNCILPFSIRLHIMYNIPILNSFTYNNVHQRIWVDLGVTRIFVVDEGMRMW